MNPLNSPRKLYRRHTRLGAVVLALSIGVVGTTAVPVSAAAPLKIYGKVGVIALVKKTGQVKTFNLIKPKSTVVIKATATTQWIPRSAAAAVVGFTKGDFAFVVATAAHNAINVEYDATPFTPAPAENFSGTVAKSTRAGAVLVTLADSTQKRIILTAKTSYYINEQPATGTVMVKVGDNITVYAERPAAQWLAVSVDEHVTASHLH